MTELLVKVQPTSLMVIAHKCPYCSNLVRYFDDDCHSCMQSIPESFWDFAFDTAVEVTQSEYASVAEKADDILFETAPEQQAFAYEIAYENALESLYGAQASINICCGQYFRECTCSFPLDFESAIANDIFDVQKAYQDPECGKCALYFTPYCSPLISYITDMYDKIEPIPVVACNEFITEQEIEKIANMEQNRYLDT